MTMAAKTIGLKFKDFLKWLERRCRTVYCTANLGHRGDGIKATYRNSCLFLIWGDRGGKGSLKDDVLRVIFDRYTKLGKRCTMAGQYALGKFKVCPNKIMAPFVPALIRDYEYELYLAGKI